jgi:Fe-S-cluster containining protein
MPAPTKPALYQQIESDLALLRSEAESAPVSALQSFMQACGAETQRVLDQLRRVHGTPALEHLQPYLPGAKKFICLQEKCTNHCCKKPTQVVETYPQCERAIRSKTGLPVIEFVTHEHGRRVLKKGPTTSACVFLDDRDACTVQEVKPYGCRMYPFVIALVDVHPDGSLTYYPSGRQIHRSVNGRPVRCFDSSVSEHTSNYHFLVPFLLHYTDCPGFTGSGITLREYLQLAEESFACSWQWWSAEQEPVS